MDNWDEQMLREQSSGMNLSPPPTHFKFIAAKCHCIQSIKKKKKSCMHVLVYNVHYEQIDSENISLIEKPAPNLISEVGMG